MHQLTVSVLPLETLHNQLMCAHNKLQVVVVIERLRNVLSESVACATRRDAPATPADSHPDTPLDALITFSRLLPDYFL